MLQRGDRIAPVVVTARAHPSRCSRPRFPASLLRDGLWALWRFSCCFRLSMVSAAVVVYVFWAACSGRKSGHALDSLSGFSASGPAGRRCLDVAPHVPLLALGMCIGNSLAVPLVLLLDAACAPSEVSPARARNPRRRGRRPAAPLHVVLPGRNLRTGILQGTTTHVRFGT